MVEPKQAGGDSKLFVLAIAAIVVIGMAGIAFVANSVGGDDDSAGDEAASGAAADGDEPAVIEQTAAVTLGGDALSPLPEGLKISNVDTDPLGGQLAPTLTATTFDGSEVTIEPDGSPKVIYFLAHWCPHCQAEVPLIQGLIDDGSLPDGVDVYGVSSIVDDTRDNHPPSDWFAAEAFSPTVVRDDADSSAFLHFGGSGLPYAVYLDGDHRVVARSVGSLDANGINELWQQVAQAG
jgi:thiol-disulfide isomerase/thioredoxin